MADSEEEDFEFLTKVLKNNCAIDEKLKNRDNSDIKFDAKVTLNFWEDECKILIEKNMKSDASNAISLVKDLNALKDPSLTPSLCKTNRYFSILKELAQTKKFSMSKLLKDLETEVNIKKQKIQKSDRDEFQFLVIFRKILKSSEWNVTHLVYFLERLREFISREMFVSKILEVITLNKFEINSYEKLQSLASTLLQKATFINEELLYSQVYPYIAPTSITFNSYSGVFNVKGEIIFMQDILDNYLNYSKIKEICITCETFHIHNTKSSSIFRFNVDHLVISAETIKIHDKVTIDLSGEAFKTVSKAETSSDGKGINGEDGFAGESGGNCYINCSSFVNSELLTIQSNGGDGSDGQDGSDGKDGVNGKDVQRADFTYNDKGFRMRLYDSMPFNGRKSFIKDDIAIDYVIQHAVGNWYNFMLCKGVNGTEGMPGGYFGYGGEGGLAGDINIFSTEPNNVKILAGLVGMEGKNGKAGFNGIKGKDGRDAWAFDHCYSLDTLFVGLDKFCKYELVKLATAGVADAWSRDDGAYISAKEIGPVNSVSVSKVRNETSEKRSKSSHAIARRKENSASKT